MKQRTAIVLGATGLIGQELVNLLLKDNDYEKVKIFHRRKLDKDHEKLEQHILELENLDEKQQLFVADDLFCCLGTTIKKAGSKAEFRKVDHDYPMAAASLAEKNKIPNFLIVTALGANPNSRFFYNKVKGEVEEDIKKKDIDAIHFFRPSILDGAREEPRFGEKIGVNIMKIFSFALLGSLKKYTPIHVNTVAKAMIVKAKSIQKGVFIHESDAIKKIAEIL